MQTFQSAQLDMRTAYMGGASGMLVSGLVWLTAALVGWQLGVKASVLTLFFGGMLIHPLGVLLDKLAGRSGQHSKGNPLAPLALESTVLLFIGLCCSLIFVVVHRFLLFIGLCCCSLVYVVVHWFIYVVHWFIYVVH